MNPQRGAQAPHLETHMRPPKNYTLIPRTDPLCQQLQGGHDSYGEGLILTPGTHFTDSTGEWLIGPVANAPKRGLSRGEPYANVHPGHVRHDGQNVYCVRFWTAACEGCNAPLTYHDFKLCAKCKSEGEQT